MRLLHDCLGKCQDIGPDISILLDFLTVEVLGVTPQRLCLTFQGVNSCEG
jgi:hypothetical protein